MKLTYFLILIILLSSCRSKKIDQRKEVKKINEVVQNDIIIDNDIQEKISIFKISKNQTIQLEPNDRSQPSQVIYKGDTLNFKNANVVFNNSEKKEKTEQDLQDHSRKTDTSSRKTDSVHKEKDQKSEIKSASWGFNLGLILTVVVGLFLLFIHFKTKSPKS